MRRAPGKLEKAIAHAVKDASWLTDTDQPAIDAAKLQARIIDDLRRKAEHSDQLLGHDPPLADADSSLTYRLDVLGRSLDGLGLSPRGRKELAIDPDVVTDDLADILSIALD